MKTDEENGLVLGLMIGSLAIMLIHFLISVFNEDIANLIIAIPFVGLLIYAYKIDN